MVVSLVPLKNLVIRLVEHIMHIMRGSLIDSSVQPRVYYVMNLFDSLVKPIALYGCEAWGGFGYKSALKENILSSLLKKDKHTNEQLHLKVCK